MRHWVYVKDLIIFKFVTHLVKGRFCFFFFLSHFTHLATEALVSSVTCPVSQSLNSALNSASCSHYTTSRASVNLSICDKTKHIQVSLI